MLLKKIHILKGRVPAVERKPPGLVLPYLGSISLQTRTKLQKSIKGVLRCCNLEIVLETPNKLYNDYRFIDPTSQILKSVVVYKFQCKLRNESYYRESENVSDTLM